MRATSTQSHNLLELGPNPNGPQKPARRFMGVAACLLGLLWLAVVWVHVGTSTENEASPMLYWLTTCVIVALPVAAIFFGLKSWKRLQTLRNETQSLQKTINDLQLQLSQKSSQAAKPSPKFTVPAPTVNATTADAAQPSLALPATDTNPTVELTPADLIRALQFPESEEDKDGIQALHLALEDREIAKLIRAAQDVLTLLSQESIYMDNLQPDLCPPNIWRRFAAGERGRAIGVIGGIHDRASLAITTGRMREDAVFRDAAHHFLRMFDKIFQNFEKNASDSEIIALSDTRTSRAFMLFARASGVFDN